MRHRSSPAVALATVLFASFGSGSAVASCFPPGGCTPYAQATEEDLYNGMYLRGAVGYGIGNKPEVSIEGWSIDGLSRNGSLATSFGLGGHVTPDWRVELSVSPILNSRIEYNAPAAVVSGTTYSGSVRNTSTILPIMFDVYHDFDTKTALRPYLGAGVGVAVSWSDLTAGLTSGGVSTQYQIASSNSASFAASAMAGLSYDVSRNLTIDLGYKYLYVDRIKTSKEFGGYTITATSKQNSFNQFLVGARYRFD
nr:OmpW family outer membrane protein [Pinisolibacter aquiterrae]